MAACDCYVSLHRSEGLGLTIAEAMALGKPTIATSYSGNVDFLNETNGYPVGYSLVRVGPHSSPYDPQALWAQPDIGSAADALRAVVEDPAEAARRGRRAMSDLAAQFSPARCGALMATRLATIRRNR
jgi:glycosyltransferase involved in cell wall biosynthesis